MFNDLIRSSRIFIVRQHAYACRAQCCYGRFFSVCLSVRHTLVLYRNDCKYHLSFSTNITLVFGRYRCYKIAREFPQQKWENLRFSTEIAVYLGNSTG